MVHSNILNEGQNLSHDDQDKLLILNPSARVHYIRKGYSFIIIGIY